MRAPSRSIVNFALVFFVCSASWAQANSNRPGVTADAVVFGQIACFSGFCGQSGLQYRGGILAAFHERNRKGGVRGRTLSLRSVDDGYEPEAAAANAKEFVASNEVFAVIGGIGTPTARRIAPILRQAKTPFVGILTGADFLRDADRFPNVVNLRTGYEEETRQLVFYMTGEMGAKRFGIIYQEDSFGRSVLRSYQAALAERGLPILAKSTYSRHTHGVHGSVFTMERADLDAVMLATTTGVAGDAINAARALGQKYVVALLSIVSVKRLRAAVESTVEPALISRVLPDVEDESIALVRRFRSALAEYRKTGPEAARLVPDKLCLEGYILGRFVVEVLARLPNEPTRKEFLATALSENPVFIDDWRISFEPGGNAGSRYVRLINSGGRPPEKVIGQ